MRWTMPILAYYLLDAGLEPRRAEQVLAVSWPITHGDENYLSPGADRNGHYGIGAYNIPVPWHSWYLDKDNGSIRSDAVKLVSRHRQDPEIIDLYYPETVEIPRHVYDAAREAVRNPVAGYADPADALAALTPPPITSPRPGR